MDFKTYKASLNKTIDTLNDAEVENFLNLLTDAYKNDKFVFVIGNGGSAANASHLAQDLAKGTRHSPLQSKRLKALSLAENIAFITAQGNDEGYESIFEQQLRTYAMPGDYLIAISGSGNSSNILKAVEWANNNGLITIGVTGFDGGKLKKIAQHSVNASLNDMCTSESIHSIIFHYVVIELHERLKEIK